MSLFILMMHAFASTNQAFADKITHDDNAAVIIAYHRVGEDTHPKTNLTTEQFQAHVQEILWGDYNVVSLDTVVKALRNKTPLPPNTIALTFDGAFVSSYDNAMRLLIDHNVPFTLFISPDHSQHKNTQYLSWNALKALSKNKNIELGLRPPNDVHFKNTSEKDLKAEINRARSVFRKKLKRVPTYFSYPSGEYNLIYRNIIKAQEFEAALSLSSGVAHTDSDIYALPRFSMTENYGSLSRFKMVANARPMPVYDIEPYDPYLSTAKPNIGFTLAPSLIKNRHRLSCFISGQDKPTLEFLGQDRVEIRSQEPITSDRTRVNCTMPIIENRKSTPHSWRWFGMLLVNP